MGRHQRYQESQSFHSLAKGFATGSALLITLSCGSQQKNVPAEIREVLKSPSAPTLNVSSLGIQLTQSGESDSPFLSEDGKKIVFIGKKRASHQHPQVYQLDLENLKERRITYQDGACSNPIFLPNGTVIYASTTDELKERPPLLNSKAEPAPYPPTELYQSDISGVDILRLTTRPGFDGFAWPRSDRPESILFSRWNGENLEIHQLNTKTKQSVPVLSQKDRSIQFLRLSPQGKKWAWVETSADATSKVFVSSNGFAAGQQKALSLPPGQYKDLAWMGEQKLIFSGKLLKPHFQLYSYDLGSQCLQSLLDSNTDLASPQIHSERQAIIFVSTTGGKSQIYYKSLSTSEQCLKWGEAAGSP